jgi:hypothetical protein
MRIPWLLLVAAVTIGCGGRAAEPPRPDRSIVAEAVSIADHWDFGSCGHLTVTLRSGAVLDVGRATSSDEGCPEPRPTVFLLGNDTSLTGRSNDQHRWVEPNTTLGGGDGPGPLVLTGTRDGEPWLAAISSPSFDCWQFRFDRGQRAYLEGETLHLTSGLVLPLANDYVPPDYPPDAFPLRTGDAVCLNSEGQVTQVDVWSPV